MPANTRADAPVEVADFAGMAINWDRRVLRPRPWTAEQSRWAAEIAQSAPPGPILELCCGAGQIGLLAARGSGRDLVQVDRDPVAAGYARRNADAAGVRSDVRDRALEGAMRPGETFPIVIADPPWLPTGQVAQYPDDPVTAVDGGADGFDVLLECLGVAMRHVATDGHVVIQVGVPQQAARVADRVREHDGGLDVLGQRDCRPGGILIHIGPAGWVSTRPADEAGEGQEGQVSEVSSFKDAGETIFPSDAVAGYPLGEDEGGRGVQEGSAGPDAPPNDDDRGRR